MRIFLCAPWDTTVLGRVTQYAHKALIEEGHEVAVFDFRRRGYSRWPLVQPLKKALRRVWPKTPSPYDVTGVRAAVDRDMNRRLLERCRAFAPELFLVFCGENIGPETLAKVKGTGAVTANWFHDSLLYASRRDLVQRVLPVYDLLFLVDDLSVLKEAGASLPQARTLPLGCCVATHRSLDLDAGERKRWGADVAFVGSLSPGRVSVLKELTEFRLGIWGGWRDRDPALAAFYREQNVTGEDAVKIYNAARVNLDIHVLFGARRQLFNVTPRVFEVPACGGFLLTPAVAQLERLYKPGDEMAVYRDTDELKAHIRYYLGHEEERRAMADRARQRANGQHTYTHRVRELIRCVEDFRKGGHREER